MRSFVEASEYIKRLNAVFDYNRSFEIVGEKIEGGFAIVAPAGRSRNEPRAKATVCKQLKAVWDFLWHVYGTWTEFH